MEETIVAAPKQVQPSNTPRRRISFGIKDIRRMHRRDGSKASLRKWAKENSNWLGEKAGRPVSKAASALLSRKR